jgi:hypothetical protein
LFEKIHEADAKTIVIPWPTSTNWLTRNMR